MKYKIFAPVDYVIGRLRYGHYEGEVEATREDIDNWREHGIPPEEFDNLKLVIDDYVVEFAGNIVDITATPIKGEEKDKNEI